MSRSIELGRAVFAIQSTNLELWLTTLITLSPDTINHSERNSIDLHSFEATELLEFIATGNAWVQRGNSMHMTLNFKKFGKPLDSHSLLQLGESLVHGPVSCVSVACVLVTNGKGVGAVWSLSTFTC
jgi:hypothetical protein